MGRLPHVVAGDVGTETSNDKVGRGTHEVAKSGTIVAEEAGNRCITIIDRV